MTYGWESSLGSLNLFYNLSLQFHYAICSVNIQINWRRKSHQCATRNYSLEVELINSEFAIIRTAWLFFLSNQRKITWCRQCAILSIYSSMHSSYKLFFHGQLTSMFQSLNSSVFLRFIFTRSSLEIRRSCTNVGFSNLTCLLVESWRL